MVIHICGGKLTGVERAGQAAIFSKGFVVESQKKRSVKFMLGIWGRMLISAVFTSASSVCGHRVALLKVLTMTAAVENRENPLLPSDNVLDRPVASVKTH